MINKFWHKKNVLITGINGFVGSNLAKKLIQNNSNVIGLVRNINHQSLFFYEEINKKCILVNGDLSNKNLIKRILIENKIEIVFHLAAQVEVGLALKNPYETFETNIRGTYSLLDTINDCKKDIKSIIIASSDKAYGDYPKNLLP
jgi:CDP-glucose 4,6-dehydratase